MLLYPFGARSQDQQVEMLMVTVVTGNMLHEGCNVIAGPIGELTCKLYISGVIDGISDEVVINGKGDYPVCIEPKVTTSQIVDMTKVYLRDNPDKRHESAAFLIRRVLTEAFPCPPALWGKGER